MKRAVFLLFNLLLSIFAAGQAIGTGGNPPENEMLLAEYQTNGIGALLEQADKLRREYRFSEALNLYNRISLLQPDSSLLGHISSCIAASENGISMLNYAARPIVTGKESLPAQDFFLFCPGIEEYLWVPVSEQLNPDRWSYRFFNPILYTEGESVIYFSRQDQYGGWDIYKTEWLEEDIWSAPEPLNNLINSTGDELFPHLSRDGKRLYFSSNGHYGIGGFDLYVSVWDENMSDWGLPQNLGLPYSSVGNDYLLLDSDDKRFSYLFSDRDTDSDGFINLYRLNYEANPIRRAVDSIEEAVTIVSLTPEQDIQRENPRNPEESREVMTNPQTAEYARIIMEVRGIQKDIDSLSRAITHNRNLYQTLTNLDDRRLLEKTISEGELSLINMQSLLQVANEEVQKREMDFLSKGTIIPRDMSLFDTFDSNGDKEQTPPPLEPVKREWGSLPQMSLLEPVQLFDYTFAIGEEAVIADDNSIPDGLIYRIQLFLLSNQTSIAALKGVRPVFEERTAAGRWLYTAGQFYNYAEASEALAQIKRAGFPSAILIAYNNGASIAIANARNVERELENSLSYQIRIDGFSAGLPQILIDILRSSTDKDIAKSSVDGRDVYLVGPFSNRTEAERIATLLTDTGTERVSIEEIRPNRQ